MIYTAEVARKFVIINYKEPHAVIEKLYLSFRTPLEVSSLEYSVKKHWPS